MYDRGQTDKERKCQSRNAKRSIHKNEETYSLVERMRSHFNSRVGLVFASMTDCCHGHSCNCAEYLQQVGSHRICFPTAVERSPSIVEWILAYKSVRLHSFASMRTDAPHLLVHNSAILLSNSTVDHSNQTSSFSDLNNSCRFPRIEALRLGIAFETGYP